MTPGKAAILAGVLLAVVSRPGAAQVPGLSAPGAGGLSSIAGGGSAAAGVSGVAGAAGAAPKGLCAGLKACLAGCKQKVCASPLGALINNGLTPFSTLSGGLIPQFCPTVPTDATIAALAAQGGPNGAGAVAAKVKQDEADAKARRAAVRYLATVDCHYWPDAEVAIISALRDDRNECVRYEAALALLNGCCCNSRTIEALNIVVSGSEKDGKPSETSERVRCAALEALQRCLLKYTPEPAAPPEAPDPPEAPRPLSALDPSFRRVAYYYQTLPTRPIAEVVSNARATAARASAAAARTVRAAQVGERSVYHALARANVARPPGAEGTSAAHEPAPAEPVVAAAAPALAPSLAPSPAPASAPIAAAAEVPRAGPSRPTAPPPVAAQDRAVVPTALAPAPPASRSHRGLFGIIRDSARSHPGT